MPDDADRPGRTFSRQRVARLAAEFAVIFASVVLALIADDWRADRVERAEEREALALISRDLDEETRSLQRYAAQLETQEKGARDFFRLLERGGPADSVLASLELATSRWNYRPALPAYTGLTQSGRLYLIRSDALRDTIISHYDETVRYLDDLRAGVARDSDRTLELLQRHVRATPGDGPLWELRLIGSVSDLARDTVALGAVAQGAQSRAWLRFRIGQIFIPATTSVQEAIAAYLD